MGRRTERFRALGQEAAATGEVAARERERARTEQRLMLQEQMLGTEQQVTGFGADARLMPFTGRMEVEAETLGGLGGAGWGHDAIAYRGMTPEKERLAAELGITNVWGRGARGYGQAVAERVNMQLGEAEALARQAIEAGDDAMLAEATQMRENAMGLVEQLNPGQLGPESALWTQSFNLAESPEAMAQQQLSSPLAQTVGGLVQRARAFQDPESEESQRFLQRMTQPGQARIAAERRAAERGVRDTARGMGAGRNPFLERARLERVGESAAMQSAEIANEASKFFETYRSEFAANTTAFAQAWLQNQGGIREQYQGAIDALATTAANFSQANADRHLEFMKESAAWSAQDKAATWNKLMGGLQMAFDVGAAIVTGGQSLLAGGLGGGGGITPAGSPGQTPVGVPGGGYVAGGY